MEKIFLHLTSYSLAQIIYLQKSASSATTIIFAEFHVCKPQERKRPLRCHTGLTTARHLQHVEGYIRKPDAGFFRELNEYSGNMVKLVTLAPNVDGAMEFIDEVHNEVCISLGHTAADYDTAAEAMRRGVHHVTHLYNAMQPLAHREPGLIGAACDDGQCMAEMICDGIHIHPAVIRATFKMFGPERIVLISDSMMATGMENGTYQLGGQEVTMKDCKATLKDGTIAGSATNLYDCMRKAVSFGVPLEEAIFAATRNPAKSIGIYDEVGSLSVGKKADILLVTDDLELREVL